MSRHPGAQVLEGKVEAIDSPVGLLPRAGDLDVDGLDVEPSDIDALLAVDTGAWSAECGQIATFFAQFGDRLPAPLSQRLDAIAERLQDAWSSPAAV